MKLKKFMGTLASAFLVAGAAHANVLPLQNAVIAATYNNQAAGVLGLDTQFAAVPGSNTTAIDPTNLGGVEFLTSDFLFGFDFSDTGVLTVLTNGFIPAASSYLLSFDFGTSLGAPITSFSLVDGSMITGLPLFSVLNDHTIGLDLSNVVWNEEFGAFTARVGFTPPSEVPEPGAAALLLAALAGLALARRRSPR